MSAFRFVVREAAENDLYEIGLESRDKWGDAQVERYLAQFVHAFELLAAAPELGQRCDDIKPGWRRLPQGTHVIFYRVVPDAETVDIVRVLHARMDPTLHVLDDD
jgi:toxin ParE1/3/4